ncbi:MAG: hypothetical protein ACREC3_09720, partial [Methyloceanibacter sp.]
MKRKTPPDDRVLLFERLVTGPADAGRDFVNRIPTGLALYILALAKRASQPHRGRPEASGREFVKNALVIWRARARKRQLQSEG